MSTKLSRLFIRIGVALLVIGAGIAFLLNGGDALDLSRQLQELLGEPWLEEHTQAPSVELPPEAWPDAIPEGAVEATVLRAIDGDTAEVLVDNEVETVRYVGVDTPERGQPGYEAATRTNNRLLGEGIVYLTVDRSNRDRYGRLLRFIYTPDGMLINRELIARGFGQPIEYAPDVSKAEEFREAARRAAETGLGFWSGQAEPDGAMPYALVQTDTDLREAPGTDQTVIESLATGTPLTVFGRDAAGHWLQVRTPDRAGGWVLTQEVFLNVEMDAMSVMAESGVVEPTPTVVSTMLLGGSDIDGVYLRVLENAGSEEVLALENRNDEHIDIGGWQVTGSIGEDACLVPADTILSPQQSYQIVSGRSEVSGAGFKCSSANLWNNQGETIYLQATDGRQISID